MFMKWSFHGYLDVKANTQGDIEVISKRPKGNWETELYNQVVYDQVIDVFLVKSMWIF